MKDHFKSIFIYICSTTLIILAYVAGVSFLPIPKENQRFVDIALGFLLSMVAGNRGYLTGGNPFKQPGAATQNVEKAETVNLNGGDTPA